MKAAVWIAPDNDYRGIAKLKAGPLPSVAVVIPAYERPAILERTIAGVAALDYPSELLEVVVVDDGSQGDLRSVVQSASLPFAIRFERQDIPGRAAGPARNLGAEMASGDVLLFLDSDCIPSLDLVRRHVSWHRRAANVVVVGSRVDVDAGNVPVEGIAERFDEMARSTVTEEGQDGFGGWRSVFHRRTQQLLVADAGYRACLSNNLSVRRERFDEVGGFSPTFTEWGGEDTELGWRLWNAGAFIVPDGTARVLHQIQDDPPDAQQSRMEARDRSLGLVADLVPQRFYRKEPSHLYTVPRVTWLVTVGTESEATEAWDVFSRLSYLDTELILIGEDDTVGSRASIAAASRDFSVVPTFGDAVIAARGEVLAIADPRAQFDRRLLARSMRRYNDPRVSAVRAAYQAGSERILRLRDLRLIDEAAGRSGLPFFGVISRRELMKDRGALADPGRAWTAGLDRSRVDFLMTDLVEIPVEALSGQRERLPGPAEARTAGVSAVTRELRQAIGSRSRGSQPTPPGAESTDVRELDSAVVEPPDTRIGIEYVGLAGHQNLGDDAMLEAIRELMPWAEIGMDLTNPKAVMLGGGTLLNAGNYYLNKVRRADGPNMERIVFGTGVRNEAYWGSTEQLDDWEPFLRSALSVGVRGPDSLAAMRSWGYDGPVEIVGDPALSLQRPDGVDRVEGRVVLCPLHTGGECWGGDDLAVFDEFARTIDRLKAEGRDVVMMTAHPGDDRWAIEIMRRAGYPDLEYVAGYEDLDSTLRLLASADLVIGERLHAVVLAAAMATPFVAVEYRPKMRDFAKSVDLVDSVVRTDEIAKLGGAVHEMGGDRLIETRERLAQTVGRLRNAQSGAARMLQVSLLGDEEGLTS